MISDLLRAKAELFATLGHPVRIHLLELLGERDHDVTELTAAFDRLDPSEVNEHLAALRHQRIVDVQRTGHEVVYTLHAPAVVNLLAEGRRVLSERERELD